MCVYLNWLASYTCNTREVQNTKRHNNQMHIRRRRLGSRLVVFDDDEIFYFFSQPENTRFDVTT